MDSSLVISQASSRELFTTAVERLHAMSTEADRLEDDVDEATFLHDMLIRLKLWAADVDEKSLEWADKIDPVVAELKPLLVQLNQEIQAFERSSTTAVSSEFPDAESKDGTSQTQTGLATRQKSKKGLLEAVESLTSYTSPLKAIDSIPDFLRTKTKSMEINNSFTTRQRSRLSNLVFKDLILLRHEVDPPPEGPKSMIGAFVFEPLDPLKRFIPAMKNLNRDDRVNVVSMENFSIQSERSTSREVNVSLPISAAVGIPMAAVSGGFSSTTTSRESFGPTKVTRYSLENATEYIVLALDKADETLMKSEIWKGTTAYVIDTVIAIGDSQKIIAMGYKKVA